MNERIKQLAEQCYQIEDPHGRFPREVFNQEKFAQLIIREYSYDCMDVTSNSEHIRFVAKKWGVEL